MRVLDDFGGFDHILAPHAGISRLQILFAVHDRLYEPSSKTGRPVPSLALNDLGAFVVVWERSSVSYQDYANIAARRFDATGTAQGNEVFVNTVSQYFQGDPDVAMVGSGSFVLGW